MFILVFSDDKPRPCCDCGKVAMHDHFEKHPLNNTKFRYYCTKCWKNKEKYDAHQRVCYCDSPDTCDAH